MPGAPGGGLPGRARQLEPGHDHDRPGVRRRHLHRAADPRVGGGDHPPGAARRAAADPGRPDGVERGRRARRVRRAGSGGRAPHRGRPRGDPSRGGPKRLPAHDAGGGPGDPEGGDRDDRRAGRDHRRGHRLSGDRAPIVHARRRGQRLRPRSRPARGARASQPRREPGHGGPDRGVGRRLEGVRARGHARRRRQRRHRVLHRERRPHGHPHRGFGDRRAAADAHRPRVSGDAGRRDRLHPRHRRGHGRLQRPVRGRPEDGAPRGDRDESPRVAIVRPRIQGHRVSDREDRGAARRRLPARRDRERHHRRDARRLRAHPGLRRREDPAVRLPEVRRRRSAPRDRR